MVLSFPTFTAGMVLSISLIMAIGPQNAHVLRMGLQRQHLWLTVAVCAVADITLIGLGVLGLARWAACLTNCTAHWSEQACCFWRSMAGRRFSGFCGPGL